MRILLLLALSPLLVACASSNPRSGTPTTPAPTTIVQPAPVTTPVTTTATPRGTTDPGTRWMPIQPQGALAAETEPRPPSRAVRQAAPRQAAPRQAAPRPTTRQPAVQRPAIMPGTPPGTPAQWTTPPAVSPMPLGDPPAGTGLPSR